MAESFTKVCAIGEIGLDYHYDFSPRDAQKRAFEEQLKIAKDLKLPAVVHNRESIKDLLEIIGSVKPPKLVLHCCTEAYEDVEPLLRQGYFLSFTGIATYSNAEKIRDTISRCPISQMMLETDAPYLSPVPFRGKRNEPAFAMEVLRLVAELKKLDSKEVDATITRNTVEFFSLPE